ncbi:MAG: NRDE family protein [Desulfatibacillaceae bacterium]
MCIAVFAYKMHPGFPLVLAANRDEFYERPTRAAHYWRDHPYVFGGLDEQEGGTWMAMGQDGRLGLLTNYRDPSSVRDDAPSRGHLVRDFIAQSLSAREWLEELRKTADRYNPFNILCGRYNDLYWFNSRLGEVQRVEPGLHGLSNAYLDTPWPKIKRAKRGLEHALSLEMRHWPDVLFDILTDTTQAPDDQLPDTGVGIECERMLSPVFIKSPTYGTRASTIVVATRTGDVYCEERTYDPNDTGIRVATDNMTSFEVSDE